MRPRELTVQGFRSYRGRTTFDFRGRRLVGVVGPIGANLRYWPARERRQSLHFSTCEPPILPPTLGGGVLG